MSGSTLPALPTAATLDGNEVVYGVQSGVDVKIRTSAIAGLSPAGNITNTGTPTVGQIAQFTAATVIQGVSFATLFAAADLSGLPTSDPGSGRPWLNGGVLQVGP